MIRPASAAITLACLQLAACSSDTPSTATSSVATVPGSSAAPTPTPSPSVTPTPTAVPDPTLKRWPGAAVDRPAPFIPGIPDVLDRNLLNFDDLDFHVFTNQDWVNLHRSHAANILVHYPDGHTTTGLPDHIRELSANFIFAPDTRITEHPVRFGTADGEWTGVMGYTDGTFTRPMTLPDGRVIQPNGRTYHLPNATLGHWNRQGMMDEEYLFYDTATVLRQLGIQ